MNDLIQNITGFAAGDFRATAQLLTLASFLLISVGLVFLARRNDLGWWVVMLGYFAGPIALSLYPGQSDLWTLLGAFPLFACAAVGMFGFSRSELAGRFTRRVQDQRFSVVAVIALLVLAFVLALLQFGQLLTSPKLLFSENMLVWWLNNAFTALIAAGFVGIGFGGRWAWFFPALGATGLAVYTATYPAERPDVGLFVYLFAYVVVLLTSLYGFFAWRTPVPAAASVPTTESDDDESAIPADDAASAAALDAPQEGDAGAEAAPSGIEHDAGTGVTEAPSNGTN
ncbi:MAG: hypothetical protein ACTH9H_09415 [Galactobacter sp.]